MRKQVLVFFLLAVTVSCQSTNSKNKNSETSVSSAANPSAAQPTFNNSMKELQETLTRVLPLVVDKEQYNKPENRKQIDQDVKRLRELSNSVSHSPSAAQKDPSVAFISKAFSEDLQRIDESLALGRRDFARHGLINVTAYCIECHTRTSTGPSFRSPALEQTLQKLSGLERGEFLLATRQFDAALKEFMTFIDERIEKKNDFFGLEKAVKHSLAVTVKYLKDPARSLKIAQKIKNAPGIPYYLRQNANGWEVAIQDWMKEKKSKDNSVAGILKRVREWIRKAQSYEVGMVDRGGDIYFLRALSELHLVLASQLTPAQMGEALYLTGYSYETAGDVATAPLHENYYATCIRKVPHSEWSAKCFKRYEEALYFGFTGSAGMKLPEDEAAQLEELRALAFPPGKSE